VTIDSYGLTADGINLPRAADWLTLIQGDYEERTGLVIDWERDVFLGSMAAVCADRLGELSEITQAVYDALVPGNATGVQLDSIVALSGVERQRATYSQATVTLGTTGAVDVIVVEGSLVEGGGADDDARWALSEDVTIPAAGTVDVVAVCTKPGQVEAAIGQIDKIVTAKEGWTTVTNAAAATPGENLETDAELRARWQASLQLPGSASANSLLARLLDLDYVQAARVIENDDGAAAVVEGILMSASSTAVVIFPSTLTTAQKEEVAETIYENLAAGIATNGTDVVTTVTDAGGLTKTIRYSWASEVTVTVAFVVTLETGYVLSDVSGPLQEAVDSYFDDLDVGDDVTLLAMYGLAADVTGIRSVSSLLLNGGAADITIDASEYATLNGTPSVTT
jgi:uncharacterized phage protein gp47/JayE